MSGSYIGALIDHLREHHQRSLRGVGEARDVDPERFDCIAEMFLGWLVKARGEAGILAAADAFVEFSTDVNIAQARYEASGRYQHKSFAEVYADHYSRKDEMERYLWGIFLTNFLWAHHTEISFFYRDRFLRRLTPARELVEIAPGHGGWGVWALSVLPRMRLTGFDISPTAIDIATRVARAAGVGDRAVYVEQDALSLSTARAGSADAVICSFLVEHLEEPSRLFAVISHLLKPGSSAFVTAALTAAQVDHIHEFRRESELVNLCEDHGLRVLETLSTNPRRTLRKARFLPRSMALVIEKHTSHS